MPDQPAPSRVEGPAERPGAQETRDACSIVPDWDVRICMVCRKPMEGRKCKYVCRTCNTMIDCSDAY